MKLTVHPDTKALIFDLDGTLIASIALHYKAYLKALEPYNVSFDMAYMFSFTGKPTVQCCEQIINDFNLPLTPEALKEKQEALFMEHIHNIEVIEPVMNVVREHKGKIPMGIATGSDRAVVNLILEKTGIGQYMSAVVTCDDVTNPKPHPETFAKCAHLLGVAPHACMAFEDGDHGMTAAREAGMTVVDVKPFYDKPLWN